MASMGEAIIGLVALTAMEIVLGIDNIIFISIVTGRLPAPQRPNAWRVGLGLALFFRILLLQAISWILSLDEPIVSLESFGIKSSWFGPVGATDAESLHQWEHTWSEINNISWHDVILFAGGLFLVGKSVLEMHHQMEDHNEQSHASRNRVSFVGIIIQIGLLDIVFSLDSVITAVGMVSRDKMWVMVTAVILAMGVMVTFASRIGEFVQRHPTIKVLALSFLVLIGVMLLAESIGTHVNKGYIYFAMVFALIVEFLNMRMRRKMDTHADAVSH